MKAICPNDPTHNRFITVAHVAQDWIVDEDGDFIEEVETTETVAKPDPGNCWTCETCGAEAKVTYV
jgi:hypothetical protein